MKCLCTLEKHEMEVILPGKIRTAVVDNLARSTGKRVTLTEAKIVVFCDLSWNPATNEQSEDRSYGRVNKGLAQSESTLIIDLFNQNTVEEHVHEVVRKKKEMISEIVVAREVIERMRSAK